MAEVQNGQTTSSGIKLFGATIAVQGRSQPKLEEPNKEDQDQTVEKRPDKIIPCPRCKSMETKFCYFNNYNVNQPRHFCKGCQRYWTAGGALRNVPVGAGRRKSKPPCQGLTGLSDDYLFDQTTEIRDQFEFGHHGVVVGQEWHVAEGRDFQHIFPMKRRRRINASSNSQPC